MTAPAADPTATSLLAARPAALAHARRRLRGDAHEAEDVVAVVIARLWERGRADGDRYSRSYVVAAVEHEVIDRWRARQRLGRALVRMSTAAQASPSVADVVTDRVHAAALLADVATPARRLLALQHLAGWTQVEVSERTGVSVGTVKSTSSRALARLRREHGEVRCQPPG